MFEQNSKNCIFSPFPYLLDPFWPLLLVQIWSKWLKIIFSEFGGQMISNKGSQAYVRTKSQKIGIFSPFLSLFDPFFGPNGSKWPIFFSSEFWGQMISTEGSHAHVWTKSQKMWVKMAQNYFFLNFKAKRFPTRGHMPIFEQNFKKWYFRSQNGPKKAKKWLFSKNEKNVPRKYSQLQENARE